MDGDGQFGGVNDSNVENPGEWDFANGDSSTSIVTLRVTDDEGLVATDTAVLTINNVAPTADPGPVGPDTQYNGDDLIPIGFNAGDSSDPGNDIVLYEWDFDSGNGEGPFDDATGVTITQAFTPGQAYTVGLRVTDEDGASDSATVIVNINDTPVAEAGSYTINEGAQVTLDGGASTDDVGVSNYFWDTDNDGDFDDASGQQHQITYPDRPRCGGRPVQRQHCSWHGLHGALALRQDLRGHHRYLRR